MDIEIVTRGRVKNAPLKWYKRGIFWDGLMKKCSPNDTLMRNDRRIRVRTQGSRLEPLRTGTKHAATLGARTGESSKMSRVTGS